MEFGRANSVPCGKEIKPRLAITTRRMQLGTGDRWGAIARVSHIEAGSFFFAGFFYSQAAADIKHQRRHLSMNSNCWFFI